MSLSSQYLEACIGSDLNVFSKQLTTSFAVLTSSPLAERVHRGCADTLE